MVRHPVLLPFHLPALGTIAAKASGCFPPSSRPTPTPMLRFCSPRVRHSQLRIACRHNPPPPLRYHWTAAGGGRVVDAASLTEFLEFERALQRVKHAKTPLDTKVRFLLSHHSRVDISDLNIGGEDAPAFFSMLVNAHSMDLKTTDIRGLGKLLKMLPTVSPRGLETVKNCGILDPAGNAAVDTFTHRYDDRLQLLTIDILITNKCYAEACRFLQIYDRLKKDRQKTIKYHFKLAKFHEFSDSVSPKVSAKDIVDNNLVHLYIRELLKTESLSLEQKLEKFLLILYKWLNLVEIADLKRPSENQIHIFNTAFLALLSRQVGIPYSVHLAYFAKLYPKSVPMLQELSLLSVPSSSSSTLSKAYAPLLSELPQVNIREELIQSSQPYMEDLSMLYSKFFHEKFPNRAYTKTLFKEYHSLVSRYQKKETSKLVPHSIRFKHPFSRYNHDSSILSAFINHTFENPTGLLRPKLTSNIVEKFYSELKFSHIDYYKSKNHKSHISQLSSLVRFFADTKNPSCDISKALNLLKLFTFENILLDIKVYLLLIDSLIKLDFLEDAKKMYLFVSQHPILSNRLTKEKVAPLCYRYSWPYPEQLLIFPSTLQNQCFTYNRDYLSGDLSPSALIEYLDSSIESQRSLIKDGKL